MEYLKCESEEDTHTEAREELRVRLKLDVLDLAHHLGITKACREYNVHRSSFYRLRQKYEKAGRPGLYRETPVAHRHPGRTFPEVVEKILEIRTEHQFRALRVMYYLDRYHGIKISESTVSRVLKAHGMSRLPKTAPKRALHTKRYAKTIPGHHVQDDVKFLQLKDREVKLVKRYQAPSMMRRGSGHCRPIRSITRLVRSSSSILWLKSFPSGSAQSEPTDGMSFKLVFTGMSKNRAYGIYTSDPKHHN